MIKRAKNPGNGRNRTDNTRPPRLPFIFGAKASGGNATQARKSQNLGVEDESTERGKVVEQGSEPADIAGAIKTLIHMAHEQGHLTYDDVNGVLADGASPDDLDTLYSKLHDVGIEVVAQAEVEKAKPEEPEPE